MTMTQVTGSQIRALAGDISGTGNAVSVDKLKGTPINATAPTLGQTLVYDGTEWVPSSGGGGGVGGSGATGQVAYWSSGIDITGSTAFTFSPVTGLSVVIPSSATPGTILLQAADATTGANGADVTLRAGLGDGGSSVGGGVVLIGGATNGFGGVFLRSMNSYPNQVQITPGLVRLLGGPANSNVDIDLQAGSTAGRILLNAGYPNGSIRMLTGVLALVIDEFGKSEFTGQVKIVDGTQGAGKVFTSDAAGLGSWQTPSGGGSNPYAGTGSFVLTNSYHCDDGTFAATPERSEAMAYDGTNLWMITDTNVIVKVGLNGAPIARYTTPEGASDLIFAFSYVWIVCGSVSLYKIDPSTGAVVATYVSGQTMQRLTSNGTYILISGRSGGGVIFRFDPTTGTFHNQFETAESSVPDSIVTDGGAFAWIIDQSSATIRRVNRDPSYAALGVFNTTWTAIGSGTGGNAITIKYDFHGTSPIVVGVVGNDITITIINGGGGDNEGSIASAVNNDPVASLLVHGITSGSNTRHNYNTAPYNAPQNLAGAVDHQAGTIDVSASGLPRAGIFANGFLWVTMDNGHLLKIDPNADTVVGDFPSGASALDGIMVDGRFIYVTETAPDNKWHAFDYLNASGEYFVDVWPAGNTPDDIFWDNVDTIWSIDRSSVMVRRLDKKAGTLLGSIDTTGHGFPRHGIFNVVDSFVYITTSVGHLLKVDPATDAILAYYRTGLAQFVNGIPLSLTGGSDAVFASEQPGLTKFTAVASGPAGNSITIEWTTGGTAGAEVVSVVGTAISVQIEDDVSTSQQIRDAVNAFPAAAALVVASVIGGGAAESAPMGPLNLINGADAVAATLTDQSVLYTAATAGAAGNSITIELVGGGTAGSETVGVVADAITVTMENNVSKASDIVAAINGDPTASTMVVASTSDVTVTNMTGITISNGSEFLVSDPTTQTVWRFNHGSNTFGLVPLDLTAINVPDEIMWDQSATFWSLDFTSNVIKRIDANSGAFQGDVSLAADGGLPLRLAPLITSGNLWVIMDSGNILRCDPYGTANILATYPQNVDLSGITTWGGDFYISATGALNVFARFVYDAGAYKHVVHTQDLVDRADRIKELGNKFWTLIVGDPTIRKVDMDGGDTLATVDITAEGSPKDLVAVGSLLYVTLTNGKVARINIGYEQAFASLVVQDLTFTANGPGAAGNLYNFELTTGATAGAANVTVYDGVQLVVQIESGVTTAQTVYDAILATTGNGPFTVTISGSSSNPQTAPVAQTFFTGGGDIAPVILTSLVSGKSALAGISEPSNWSPSGPLVGFTSPSNGYLHMITAGAANGVGDGFYYTGLQVPGGQPDRMAADATDLWVCDQSGATDSPFRVLISTMTILANITGAFGGNNSAQAVALLGGYVYMGDSNFPLVYKINPATNAVIKRINVGDSSGGNNWAYVRGMISDGSSLWVVSSVGNSFSTRLAIERITSDRSVAGIMALDNDVSSNFVPMVKVGDALFARMNYNMHRFNANLG